MARLDTAGVLMPMGRSEQAPRRHLAHRLLTVVRLVGETLLHFSDNRRYLVWFKNRKSFSQFKLLNHGLKTSCSTRPESFSHCVLTQLFSQLFQDRITQCRLVIIIPRTRLLNDKPGCAQWRAVQQFWTTAAHQLVSPYWGATQQTK